eukprot:TRINITY_DN3761_c0_g1_i1.p1 TRINITY_DN3761_c0_g1~~TRINITY_DN3761_c0_g1_i1.p1  ORF type:complete len:559 (+),score=112.03 TRINITY_DN3761_c0_g1_i1:110-1678(+)
MAANAQSFTFAAAANSSTTPSTAPSPSPSPSPGEYDTVEVLQMLEWLYDLKVPEADLPSSFLRDWTPGLFSDGFLWCSLIVLIFSGIALLLYLIMIITGILQTATSVCSEPDTYYTKLQRNSAKFLIIALAVASVLFICLGMWATYQLKGDSLYLLDEIDGISERWISTSDSLNTTLQTANDFIIYANITYPGVQRATLPDFYEGMKEVAVGMDKRSSGQWIRDTLNLLLLILPMLMFTLMILATIGAIVGALVGVKSLIVVMFVVGLVVMLPLGVASGVSDFGSLFVSEGCHNGYSYQFQHATAYLEEANECEQEALHHFFTCEEYNFDNETKRAHCTNPWDALHDQLLNRIMFTEQGRDEGKIDTQDANELIGYFRASIASTHANYNCTDSNEDFKAITSKFCRPVARHITLMSGAFASVFGLTFFISVTSLYAMNRLLKPRLDGYEDLLGEDDDLGKTDDELFSFRHPLSVARKFGCVGSSIVYFGMVIILYILLLVAWILIGIYGFKYLDEPSYNHNN